jgi:hypothetical protein
VEVIDPAGSVGVVILLLAWCVETIWRIGRIETDVELETRVITVRAGVAF